jgi:purine-binding chemotaxis protein CheW
MSNPDDIQVVVFRVGFQEFAFDILQVERILRYVQAAPLPKSPAFLEGVIPYEGGALPVLDLRKRFELDAPVREDTRLMVLALEDQRAAFVVDAVREVARVDSRTISAPGPTVSGLAAAYIAGVITRGGRMIIVLNARKLLTSSERLALAAAGVGAAGVGTDASPGASAGAS